QLARIKLLRDHGVGPAQQDATVSLYSPKALFSEEEWEQVKGNCDAVVESTKKKLGTTGKLPWSFGNGPEMAHIDENDRKRTNKYIGYVLRLADVEGKGKGEDWVDEKVARVVLGSDQFAQTGGNLEQILAKRELNKDIEKRRQDVSDEDENAKYQEL